MRGWGARGSAGWGLAARACVHPLQPAHHFQQWSNMPPPSAPSCFPAFPTRSQVDCSSSSPQFAPASTEEGLGCTRWQVGGAGVRCRASERRSGLSCPPLPATLKNVCDTLPRSAPPPTRAPCPPTPSLLQGSPHIDRPCGRACAATAHSSRLAQAVRQCAASRPPVEPRAVIEMTRPAAFRRRLGLHLQY